MNYTVMSGDSEALDDNSINFQWSTNSEVGNSCKSRMLSVYILLWRPLLLRYYLRV